MIFIYIYILFQNMIYIIKYLEISTSMKNGIHHFGEKDYLFSKYSDQNPMKKNPMLNSQYLFRCMHV